MISEIYGVTPQARALVFLLGLALCFWTWTRLRKRALLLSVGSILTAVGFGLVCFSFMPVAFDFVAYRVGVKYPPLLYLIVALLVLAGLLLHLAARISWLDTRCRRLTQEVSLLNAELEARRLGEHAGAADLRGGR